MVDKRFHSQCLRKDNISKRMLQQKDLFASKMPMHMNDLIVFQFKKISDESKNTKEFCKSFLLEDTRV